MEKTEIDLKYITKLTEYRNNIIQDKLFEYYRKYKIFMDTAIKYTKSVYNKYNAITSYYYKNKLIFRIDNNNIILKRVYVSNKRKG